MKQSKLLVQQIDAFERQAQEYVRQASVRHDDTTLGLDCLELSSSALDSIGLARRCLVCML